MAKPTARNTAAVSRTGKRRVTAPSEPTFVHPRAVPTIAGEPDEVPDQPFEEGVRDQLDSELRYRMISERAYHRYVERGYTDGADLDDWLQAEAEIDHLLLGSSAREERGG